MNPILKKHERTILKAFLKKYKPKNHEIDYEKDTITLFFADGRTEKQSLCVLLEQGMGLIYKGGVMNLTKILALVGILLLTGCASQPKNNVIVPAPALREVFRGGEIQGLEDNSGHYMGRPSDYDLVEHVCTSMPIYDSRGVYVRTSVKCW